MLIESSINTKEMHSRLIYVIDITFGINESIFSGNEQQKLYLQFMQLLYTAKDISTTVMEGDCIVMELMFRT